MWSGPSQDPGGSTGPPNTQELNDLKDQFEQQQLLIAQLKEMLRKNEQTTVTQEKVDEYANTLTKMKARAKRNAKKDGSKENATKRLETPASEKINLLRQQLEENRAKLAERGKNQKGIEEMVTQLKAQLDDSQILMNQTPLNLSLTEPKLESYSVNSSSQELHGILVNKERKITEMASRIQKLEASVLDLQENLKEKDSVIDARTKAITLMSENLSKKGKSTLDALDDTKLQMRKMQENFVELEMQMKEENNSLLIEVQQKEIEIINFKQKNIYLEELQQKLTDKIDELQNQTINKTDVVDKALDLPIDINNLHIQIKELEAVNATLERQLETYANSHSLLKSDNSDVQEVETLQKELEDRNKKCDEFKLKLENLEKEVEEKKLKITECLTAMNNLEGIIKELENKSQKSDSKLVSLDIKLENEEINKLRKQLEESNKNMIKVKAQHKSKIKELNKKVDSFKKISDVAAEVVKLHDDNSKLNQKIAELEEEKGALQLKIMETDSTKDSTSVECVNELEQKLSQLSVLLTEKDNNIDLLNKRLEESTSQNEDLNEKLLKLTHLQNVQVKSEITSIQLEEQMDKLELEKQELIKEKERMLQENTSLTEKLEKLKKEKQEILVKLESYVQENIELVDKLEKLSGEKVSSAESIEIVEGLTQQEKLELEAYQQITNVTTDVKTSNEHLEENPELHESVNQLTEETSELLQRIELFTVERREVMEKMEQLTQENNQLNLKIKEIENNRDVLAETYEQLQNEKEQLDDTLQSLKAENNTLEDKIKILETDNEELKRPTEKDINVVNVSNACRRSVEDLMNDIEEYKGLIEIQKQEIKELKVNLLGQDFIRADKFELEAKVSSLQLQYENILSENDSLINKLRGEQSEHTCEREEMEEELALTRKRINEFEKKIAENLQEIENYKSILEENKNELITSAMLINEMQNNISALKNEVTHYTDEVTHLNSIITDLNAAVAHLENENKENTGNVENVNLMSSQLEELKQALTQNIEEIRKYQKESENNSVTISDLQNEIKTLNLKILETEHLLESKNDELKVVEREREEKDNMIQHLSQELKTKDESFHKGINNLKDKYLSLQKQLDANAGSMESIRQPLERKIQELETKNKEQLDKMKIIAANLKKKTQALQNLEKKYTEANEKWETEQKEKETLKDVAQRNIELENQIEIFHEKLNSSQNDITNQSIETQKLKEELSNYQQRCTSLENINTKLSEEVSTYTARFEDAQNVIKECEKKVCELTSENERIKSKKDEHFNSVINEKEINIKDLSEQLENLRYASKTNSNALEMKIQELELFIETQDADLTKYKDRVNKLEEGLAFMEERRMSLERTAHELGAQLREKTNEYEEVSQTEDILEKRLSKLMSHDQIIEKKLHEMINENEDLNRHIKTVTAANEEYKEKLKQMKDSINSEHVAKEMLLALETELITLRKTVNSLENDKKNIRNEYEQKLLIIKEDNEKMETELQNQLVSFDQDRKNFIEKNESMSDQMREYIDQQESLLMELTDSKHKLDEQNKILSTNNEMYVKMQEELQLTLNALNELKDINKDKEDTISKLTEKLYNNNVLIDGLEQSNKDLQERCKEMEGYQKENSHPLQIETFSNEGNQLDFAASFYMDNDLQNMKQINEDLRTQVNALHKEKENITLVLSETQHHLDEIKLQTSTLKEEPSKSEELKSLKAQYNNLEMNFGKISEENIILKNQIINLSAQLQKTSILQEENNATVISTFTWPVEEDAITKKKFADVEVVTIQKPNDTNEQLLNNIKSLELMLQDAEKQKEDALKQCNTLLEELTKLHPEEHTRKPVAQSEDINPKLSPTEQVKPDLESQIVSPDSTKLTPTDLEQLHALEFSLCKDIVDHQGPSTKPIIEEPIKPESSYLCYNPEDFEPNKSVDIFEENDDGWGWGPDEAKLEEEHFERSFIEPQNEQFKSQINVLEEKIRVLEQARERHLEEIKQSQLKSGKLIKKLKEFKIKNEELSSQVCKKSDGFDDLNDAIQEELKSQVQSLEKKNKEVNADLEKEKQEKNNLLKRVDTLTASHEKLIENKEKQDVEIMSWQQRYRELNTRLEQFEWGGDGSYDSPKHIQKQDCSEIRSADIQRIEELTDAIKELTLDNEELQALLEEQRNLRIAAEKLKSIEPIAENMKTEKEYIDVLNQRDSFQRDLSVSNEQIFKLREEHAELVRVNEIIQQQIQQLTMKNQQLSDENARIDQLQPQEDLLQKNSELNIEKQQLLEDKIKTTNIIGELRLELVNLRSSTDVLISNEKTKNEQKIIDLTNTITAVNNRIDSLSLENNTLQTKVNDLEKENASFITDIKQRNNEKNELHNVISELKMKINNMEQQLLSVQNLNSEIKQMKELLIKKEEELSALQEKIMQQETEYEFKLSGTIQQLSEEWAEKVDQRGYDIAESWKLHVEARENEFVHIEQQLKKEINDLEEKYTTLVNENNELRKNVDTEIRNEIDRVSALQQQINERQHYINDLSKIVQDQQAEIENKKLEVNNLNSSIIDLNKQIERNANESMQLESIMKSKDDILKELTEENKIEKEKISKIDTELENIKQTLSFKDLEIQDKENQITQLSQQIENFNTELTEKISVIDDLSSKLHNFQSEAQINNNRVILLNEQITEYQQQISDYRMQMQQQYIQIEALNQDVLQYGAVNQTLLQKDVEINRLTCSIQEKEQEYATAIKEQATKLESANRRITESENQYEEMLSTKEVDMQSLRIQLDEQVNKTELHEAEREDFMHIQTELAIKTAEYDELKNKFEQQNTLIDEESKQLEELREIIQDQVLKIDNLQKELYEKSNNYDALIAEVDITHKAEETSEKHVKFKDNVEIRNTPVAVNEEDLSEPVSRAELDLALYMLHQRDVRCEELTVELMQLLEERDTLQLKLSNSLREQELLKKKSDPLFEESLSKSHSITEAPSAGDSLQPKLSPELPSSSSDSLVSKLSELKRTGYHKDKTIVDEQEFRRFQQLSIMQQHRDEAAKLPPEAAARLVDASYTLSRDFQSPSKVLLNWLWGRSIPKVNNV